MCWAWALPVGHREILSYSLFVHFNKDVCKGFVYFCLSGLNHRQWKYSFNLICRLLKLNGGCLFYCTTNKYVCIYGLSIFCLFSFSWHIVLQLPQDFWSNNDLITDIRTFDMTSEEDYSCQGCTSWQFLLSAASFFWMFFRKEKYKAFHEDTLFILGIGIVQRPFVHLID